MAYEYASRGYRVCISSRRIEKLQNIANKHPDNIICVPMDVSYNKRNNDEEPYGASDGFDFILNVMGGADIIVYCAGAGEQNTVLNIEKELLTSKVNINGFLIIITKSINYFIENNKCYSKDNPPLFGVISSIAGLRGMGISTSYSATKRFQITYMEGMSQFVHKNNYNIKLCTILPGFVDTSFISGRKYPFTMSKEYTVKLILRAFKKGKFITILDWKWQFIAFIWRLIPGFIWRRIRL